MRAIEEVVGSMSSGMFGLHLRGVLGEVDTLGGGSLQGQQCPKISKCQIQKIKSMVNRKMGKNIPRFIGKEESLVLPFTHAALASSGSVLNLPSYST